MKKTITLMSSMIYLSGCGSSSTDNNNNNNPITQPDPTQPDSIQPEATQPEATQPEAIITIKEKNCEIGNSRLTGKVIDNLEKGIANVSVNIEGCKTITNNEGIYYFNNIKEGKQYIKLTSKEYSKTFIPIKILENLKDTTEKSFNYITTKLSKFNNTKKIESVYLPNGEEYVGEYKVNILSNNVNTKEYRRNFPGEFIGENSNNVLGMFESLGIYNIEIKDKDNKNYYISENINIDFKNIESSKEFLPLWKYDEYHNRWRESGLAYNKGNGVYSAEIEQVGIWAINIELGTHIGTYKGRIVYTDNTPAKNLRVYMTGKHWISSQLMTTSNGEFEIPIKSNEQYSIYAYTFKDNYKAEYNNTPPLPIVEADGIIDDRT